MKKITDYPKLFRTQKRKFKRTKYTKERRNKSRGFYKTLLLQKQQVLEKGLNSITITPPSVFSFVNNTEDFIDFLSNLKTYTGGKRNILIDLSHIEKITNDALICLLSVIQNKKTKCEVFIKHPVNTSLADRVAESGISEQYINVANATSPKWGRIRQKSGFDADMEKSNELIRFATTQIFGKKKPLRDVQRILSECIDNTTFHAKPGQKLGEMWWGTVFCDTDKRIAYFSILDNGVGIIESIKEKMLRNLVFFIKYKNNADLIKAIFHREVLSSTEQHNRGNGLPNIFEARERNEFSRLIVISNNVFVDFDKDKYEILRNSFSGTFFYWEVRNNDDGA